VAHCRRRPRLGAAGWFQGARGADGVQQESGLLHSLSDFLDTVGSGISALGLFSQVRSVAVTLLQLYNAHSHSTGCRSCRCG